MKKAIGLTANTSDFRPNLPQTKHLNYFMGTNPIYMANGGDVKAGIPNYPDVNVTRGFLPAALGFDNGGEANSNILQQIDKLMLILGGDMKKVIEYLKKWLGYTDEQINSALNQKDAQVPSDRQPGIDIANQIKPVTPKDTVTTTPSDRQPGLDVPLQPLVPSDRQPQFNIPPSLVPLPKISIEQRQRDFEDKQRAPDTVPGITSIIPSDRQPGIGIANEMQPTEPKEELPFYLKPFDFNKDGKITQEDLDIAIQKGFKPAIDAIKKWLGLSGTDPEDLPDIEIEPDLEDDKGGITEIKPSDRQPGLEKEDQETLKKGSEIMGKSNQEQIEIANTRGITALDPSTPDPDKKKKDVPAWALPMMSAGFAMMASKSPYFLQALGEGGQKGLETLTAQKTAEEEKLDKESQRDLQTAQAAYYRGEGRQPSSKTMVQGGVVGQIKNGVWEPIIDSTTNKPLRATIGRAEAIEMLSKNEMYNMASREDKEKMITEYMDIYNNTNTFINDKLVEQDTGGGILESIDNWVKDWLGLKDGGIVSLRR